MLSEIKQNASWNGFFAFAVVALVGYVTGIIGAVTVVIALSFILIKKEQYNSIVILFFLTFFFADLVSLSSSFFDPLRFVFLGICLLLTIQKTSLKENNGLSILPFVIIAFYFSLFYSPIPFDASIRAVAYFLLALVIFGFIRHLFKEYPLQFSANIFLLIGLFFIIPLLLSFSPFRENFFLSGRYTGFMGNPNGLGLVAILSIPILDYLYIAFLNAGGSLKKQLLYFLKWSIIISVVLTGSRNAIFSILIYEFLKFGFKSVTSSVITLFLLSISYFFIFHIDWIGLVNSLGLEEYLRLDSLESASGRTEVWEVVWDEIKKSPLTGKGILYDIYFVKEYRSHLIGVIPRAWSGVWNSYLSLWMSVGLIGLIAYFYFIFRLFLQSNIKRLMVPFLVAALFSGIAESWMAASLNAFTPLFFLYFALQSVPIEDIKQKAFEGTSTI